MKTLIAIIDDIKEFKNKKVYETYITSEDEKLTLFVDVTLENNNYTPEIVGSGQCIMFDEGESKEQQEEKIRLHREAFDEQVKNNQSFYDKITERLIEEFKAEEDWGLDSFEFEVDI